MFKRWLLADLALCGLLGAAVALARGQWVAYVAGGEFRLADGWRDAAVIACIVVILRAADLALCGLATPCGAARPSRRNLIALARLALVSLVAAPLLMALAQFCPQRVHSSVTPADLGLGYEAVTIDSDGLRLAAWHIPAESPDRPVVLISHGLGVNKAAFLHAAQLMHDLGYHVLIFDFRAHGESDGRVTTFGYLEAADVRAARSWIARRYTGKPVFGLGYSMGAAALLRAAGEGVVFDGLIVDSAFARAEDVARGSLLRALGPLRTPAWHAGRFWGWVLTGADLADHQPVRCMAGLAGCPVFLIHGAADSMIPCEHSRQLQRACGDNARLWLPPDAGHTQAALCNPEYAGRIADFIETIRSATRRSGAAPTNTP